MASSASGALARLRRPEYTGENRCVPCTVLNAAIAVVVAVVLSVAVPLDTTGGALVGSAVLAVSAAAIYLRGYLVPGTPYLTETYVPDRFLRYFEHGPAPMADDDLDPAALLERTGAVTECEDVDDLCLTDGFRTDWDAQIEALRDSDATRADLAAILDIPDRALSFDEHGDAFVAVADGGQVERTTYTGRRRVGQWESKGAFLADMAGARVLAEYDDGWDRLTPHQRGRVLNGLRLFLERCPSCGAPVTFGQETVRSCCRSRQVVAVTCEDCGDRLFEAEAPVED